MHKHSGRAVLADGHRQQNRPAKDEEPHILVPEYGWECAMS